MEELPKAFVKVLVSALVRLHFYKDPEISFNDILDQADGRSSLSRQDLITLCQTYITSLQSLFTNNPSDPIPFLTSLHHSSTESAGISEIWLEEKQTILHKTIEKHDTEWNVKGEPSWSIDIQTFGKFTESSSIPVANFKFELNKQDKDKTLQFSVEKDCLAVLLTSLEQANFYLSSSLSS